MITGFKRIGDIFIIDGEVFSVKDVQAIFSEYVVEDVIHYYDGKKHYKSDGLTQVGLSIPYDLGENILKNKAQIKLCKQQREIDEKHIEHLRNARR
jgi:hypothetical protein